MKEVKEKRYAGPYSSIPFKNYIQSPIGLVPKAGNQTRLIFHLSYNFDEDKRKSVNFYTPDHLCSVHYRDLDHAVKTCLKWGYHVEDEGEEADLREEYKSPVWMSKTDLKSAFRMVPLSRESWKFLMMRAINPITGKTVYLVEKCLPFGGSISCSHFQRFSNCLQFLIECITGCRMSTTNYLDDFLFVSRSREGCNRLVHSFLDLCRSLRVPVALEKTVWAQKTMVFLGIEIDGDRHWLKVPEDKRLRALNQLLILVAKRKAKVRELEKLTGLLNFLCKAIFPGRAFTRRMYAKYSGNNLKPYHHCSLDSEFKADCAVWIQFLDLDNHWTDCIYRPFVDLCSSRHANQLRFWTDASKNENFGIGCVFMDSWLFCQWEEGFIRQYDPSIAYLELTALCVGVITWIEQFKNSRIVMFCDNMSVCAMVNKMTSSCKNCMKLLRILVLKCLYYNVRVFVRYIDTKSNVLSDSLSRMQIKKFRKLAPGADLRPTPIPARIWPPSKLWIQ